MKYSDAYLWIIYKIALPMVLVIDIAICYVSYLVSSYEVLAAFAVIAGINCIIIADHWNNDKKEDLLKIPEKKVKA